LKDDGVLERQLQDFVDGVDSEGGREIAAWAKKYGLDDPTLWTEMKTPDAPDGGASTTGARMPDGRTAAGGGGGAAKGTPAGGSGKKTPPAGVATGSTPLLKKDGTPYKSVKDCVNFDEFTRYMYDTLGVKVSPNLRGLNVKAMVESASGVEAILNEMPAIKPYFKGFDITYGNVIMDCGQDGVIGYRKKHYATYANADDTVKEEGHHHPANPTIAGHGAHEAGHLAELALIHQSEKYTAAKNAEAKRIAIVTKNPDEQMERMVEWENGRDAREIIKTAWEDNTKAAKIIEAAYAIAIQLTDGKSKTLEAMRIQLSDNATENYSECLADCVEDCYNNPDNAQLLSRIVKYFLERRLQR
jgi:hypothetical protein